jgi:hypothetical protein
LEPSDERSAVRFRVEEVVVSVKDSCHDVDVIVEGDLSEDLLREVLIGLWTSITTKTQQNFDLVLV